MRAYPCKVLFGAVCALLHLHAGMGAWCDYVSLSLNSTSCVSVSQGPSAGYGFRLSAESGECLTFSGVSFDGVSYATGDNALRNMCLLAVYG